MRAHMTLLDVPDLPEAAFGGDIPARYRRAEYIRAMGVRPQKGGGLGAAVAVVASIAIPFVAPAVAGALSISSTIGSAIGSVAAGNVLGSAIVGAGLGAVTAAVTGQDVGRGALMGGIGGGVAGYISPPAAALPSSAVSPQALAAANASADPLGALIASQNWTPGAVVPANIALTQSGQVATASPGGWTVGGQIVPSDTIAYGGQIDSTLAQQLSSSGDAMGAATAIQESGTLSVNTPTSLGGNAGYLGTTGYYDASGVQPAGLRVPAQPGAAAPAPENAWQAIGQRFSDPKSQAEIVLRAAGQLAGSALAGEGVSPEQQRLIDEQKESLRALQASNTELFNQKLAWAQNLIGEASYFDPEYFGLRAQRGVQTIGAQSKRDIDRRLSGTNREQLRAAEKRRVDLAVATGGESAYLQGADMAQQNKIRTLQAGLAALPKADDYTVQYGGLAQALRNAEQDKAAQEYGIGAFFGDIMGTQKSRAAGLTGGY